jgi:hypothetical protein
MSANVVEHLSQALQLSDARLCKALALRTNYPAPSLRQLRQWRAGDAHVPLWVERTCVTWLVELWQAERKECTAQQLWPVDQKYLRMLEGFTVADLMQLGQKPKAP